MNKIKIILVCLLIPLIFLVYPKIKAMEEFQQKVVLAKETRKVLENLMLDLIEARKSTFLGVPADGVWHSRIAFDRSGQGALEYIIKGGHLWRINNGKGTLIADDIADLRIRRQRTAPDIFEIQIKAQNKFSLVSNLRIRIPR